VSVPYSLDKETELLNYEAIRELAIQEKPKLIVAGYTAYPRIVDFKKFREICDEVGAYMMVDMSHFSGLVAGGEYPSPFLYADVVMTTAHKTLRGPRAGIIFVNKELRIKGDEKNTEAWKMVDRAIFPGLQGGPHANQIAAVAVAMKEAAETEFKEYARQVVLNAKTLAEELKNYGFRIVAGGTDTHLLLVEDE
jgi:glycine hydroxymethyltransferase